jgi:hypothetical protein
MRGGSGDSFRNGAALAEGRRGEFEAVEVRVESNVARTQLGEDAALRATQVRIHPLQGLGGSRVVKGGDPRMARRRLPFLVPLGREGLGFRRYRCRTADGEGHSNSRMRDERGEEAA